MENSGRQTAPDFVYPVQSTFFMEIIRGDATDEEYVRQLLALGKKRWKKDPYVVRSGFSIRARMFAAMVREALFLVENGYASIESVDRSCRNDAGYYLPFAGNFRYMDLMGTYGYGVVMETLNPELADQREAGELLDGLVRQGKTGMDEQEGFYTYAEGTQRLGTS